MVSIPHAQGCHGLFPQRYPETEWVIINSEFRTPIVNDGRGDMLDASTYGGVQTIIDAETMEIVAQVVVPVNLDLAATDYGGKYSFATSYNSEGGATISEMLAKDTDYLVVFDWDAIKAALERRRLRGRRRRQDAGRQPRQRSDALRPDPEEPARRQRQPGRQVRHRLGQGLADGHRGRHRQAGRRLSPATSSPPTPSSPSRRSAWARCTPPTTAEATPIPRCSSTARW